MSLRALLKKLLHPHAFHMATEETRASEKRCFVSRLAIRIGNSRFKKGLVMLDDSAWNSDRSNHVTLQAVAQASRIKKKERSAG